jgi:uncharacterized protein DUF1064
MNRFQLGKSRKGKVGAAVPTIIDGIRFDSKLEASRYVVLKRKLDQKLISNLECHPRYAIIHPLLEHEPKLKDKLICTYIADFRYVRDGVEVTEDVKGAILTDVYKLKKKLVRMFLGIHIVEVRRKGRHPRYVWSADNVVE